MKFDKESIKFGLTALTFQVCLIILFAFLATYDPTQIPADSRFTDESPERYYPMFQDIHVMMFVGFGFLLVFPYLYSWSAVVFTFMMGAFVLQWSLLTLGFFEKVHHHNYSEPIELTVPRYCESY
jgi:ammonium transporter Rh